MHKDITFEFRDKVWLYQKYVGEQLPCIQIAELCHCHPRTIHQRLVKFGIPRRAIGFNWTDKQKEHHRQWNKCHPENGNLLGKWNKEHPFVNVERLRQWHKDNPEASGMKGKTHSNETKRKMSESKRGNKHPNWKGGLTQIVRGIRRASEYYQWRKEVLERDNYICQDCHLAKKVDAHHIRSLVDYPKGIFEIENGLTLCEECHKIHTSWQWLKRERRSNYAKKKALV